MDIISRGEWGAQYGDGVGSAPLPASELWLHHSVTVAPDVVQPFDDDYAAIRTIERIGAERFGEAYGFPYTFGVTPVGLIFAGHHLRKNGAHTKGRNSVARAIVLVGNYETEEPTQAQIQAVARLVRHGYDSGWWSTRVLSGGHRDAPDASTACPGANAYARIGDINQLALNPPTPVPARKIRRDEHMQIVMTSPANQRPHVIVDLTGIQLGLGDGWSSEAIRKALADPTHLAVVSPADFDRIYAAVAARIGSHDIDDELAKIAAAITAMDTTP